jgi:hypothetical protein
MASLVDGTQSGIYFATSGPSPTEDAGRGDRSCRDLFSQELSNPVCPVSKPTNR